jgi:hypothetical protein
MPFLDVVVAKYDYQAQDPVELSMKEGELFLVLDKCDSDWWNATSVSSHQTGQIPSNFVDRVNLTPILHSD